MLQEAFTYRGHEFAHYKDTRKFFTIEGSKPHAEADVVLHGWASGATQPVPKSKNIYWLRRYELFDGGMSKVDWSKADHLIVVNSWIQQVVAEIFDANKIKTPVSLIYNGTDPARWRYRERKPAPRVGMACHVHPKKNLPLAMQVMACLPPEYELHIAGAIQDACTAEYLNHMGKVMRRKVYLYGHIDRSQLNDWWEQFPYCLSTSISEGNPNNVIEAMAKGIKPIVHHWPGAEDQFRETFDTPELAARMIQHGALNSSEYRRDVEEKFGMVNVHAVVDLAESL